MVMGSGEAIYIVKGATEDESFRGGTLGVIYSYHRAKKHWHSMAFWGSQGAMGACIVCFNFSVYPGSTHFVLVSPLHSKRCFLEDFRRISIEIAMCCAVSVTGARPWRIQDSDNLKWLPRLPAP